MELAEKFPMLPFAGGADIWLEFMKNKEANIFQQLRSRHMTQFTLIPLLCTAGLGLDKEDFICYFNTDTRLELGFGAIGHEVGHTFHFELAQGKLLPTVDTQSKKFFYDFDEEGNPQGFFIEDFCDAFSLQWLAINTKEKVREWHSKDNSMLSSFLLWLSESREVK